MLDILAEEKVLKASRWGGRALRTKTKIKITADFSPEAVRPDRGVPSLNVNLKFHKQQNAFKVEG